MADQLAIYNEALVEHLGERELASLAENREPRRVLDALWGSTTGAGHVKFCLEQGNWKFAQRGARLDYSTGITPSFGLRRVFEKPVDFVKVSMLCTDEWFNSPLLQYTEEAGFWCADYDQIFISYVSNGPMYGGDLNLWPESFVRYVAASLAARASVRLKQSGTDKEALDNIAARLLVAAKSKDALQGPTKFFPQGAWVQSRGGAIVDRGSKANLYG